VRAGAVASLDVHHGNGAAPAEAGDVADMQTATLCERGLELGVELAAVLIVTEDVSGGSLDDEPLATAAKRAGAAAAAALGPSKPESNPKVEG
jgi:hypothetical protein